MTLLGNQQVDAPPAPVWTPDGGASAGSPAFYSVQDFWPAQAIFEIECTQTAVWTYTSSGSGVFLASVPSGSSSTIITLYLDGDFGFIRSTVVTLSSTAGGITKYYSITLTVDGS